MAASETTTSTHRMSSVKGVHLFKVAGHSLINSHSISVRSKPVQVGGHYWDVEYFPCGNKEAGEQHTSVFAYLKNAAGKETVRANLTFSILGDPDLPATRANKIFVSHTTDFSAKMTSWGFYEFVKKDDLAASGCLKDDCLVIKCIVEVISADLFEGHEDELIMPPSEFSRDIGKIVEDGTEADLNVKIVSLKSFRVHKCVLAAVERLKLMCGSKLRKT